MNYERMLKIPNKKYENNSPVIEMQYQPINLDDTAQQLADRMFSLITEYNKENQNNNAPPEVEHTVLNDKEITDVLSYLLELQEKYFPDLPLSRDLCKQFMWNIPRPVYDAFREARDYGIDAINPMVLFYIFCVDDTKEVIYKFLEIFVTKILNNDDWDYIVKKAEEYDEYMSEDFDDNDNIEE